MLKPCVVWLVLHFASCSIETKPPETDVTFELLGHTGSEEEAFQQQISHRDGYLRGDGVGTVVTTLQKGTTVFKLSESPYILKNDITVGADSKLIIEAGVEVKSYPGVGIDVKGILEAQGYKGSPIILTRNAEPTQSSSANFPRIRLIDGPSILAGRVQLFQHGKWYSLCTHSNKWTQKDLHVACQQLGFEGGKFWKWFPREDRQRPRMVYKNPGCDGTEKALLECNWTSRKIGGGSCDGHPDLGIQCSVYHRKTHAIDKHWRGIKFEHAKSEMQTSEESAQGSLMSYSRLNFVYIRYGGVGPHYSAISALEIIGVPPEMDEVYVTESAYNGISIMMPNTVVNLYSVSAKNNRGFGIYISSYYDPVMLSSGSVTSNGADGVKYVRQEKTDSEFLDDPGFKDLCTLSESDIHTYPIYLRAVLDKRLESHEKCFIILETQPDQKFTLSFLQMWGETTNEGTAVIEVYDGAYESDPILAKVNIKNGMKAQSVVSTGNVISIQFKMKCNIDASVFMKLTSSYEKYTDLAVISTTIEDNNGNGISLENPLSMLRLLTSYICNNSIAGINVLNGVADINFIDSHAILNKDSGINLLYLHGRTTINDSVISSNSGPGIAIWPSQEREPSYIVYNEAIFMRDSQIIKNSEYGLVFESSCSKMYINLTRNVFMKNGNNALDIKSCLKDNNNVIYIQVEHNDFTQNHMLDIKIEPAVNIEGVIEHNNFSKNAHGCVLIRNHGHKGLDNLPTNLIVKGNNFKFNNGTYVVNIGLSPSSKVQVLHFTRNTMVNNLIHEPYGFLKLVARNRVAAVVIVSSSNVIVFRNIIENPLSVYEIGTHLENPNAIINCTYNWLGYQQEHKLVNRIFDRTERYNLAQIEYLPFLLNNSILNSSNTMDVRTYKQQFVNFENRIGGELNGIQILKRGTYTVQRDIHVLPGGKLILQPGVILRFPPSIGMLISGKLEALGRPNEQIMLTLEDGVDTANVKMSGDKVQNVQLLGGRNSMEGLLQVRVGGKWGTVCNHGWTLTDAAIVCHSLGYIVNPNDWFMSKEDISGIGNSKHILLSNVQCNEDDVDILECKSEMKPEFQNSCTHENVVGVRCYPSSWAGIRFGMLAERSILQFVTVEKAGLFDYSTNSLSAAIQMDFAHHLLNFTKVQNNLYNGLEIMYPCVYCEDLNMVRNSTFQHNGGNGISIHHLGFQISGSELSYNKLAGVYYSPSTKLQQQKEIINWLKIQGSHNMITNTRYNSSYTTIVIPEHESGNIHIGTDDIVFIVTERINTHPIMRHFQLMCDPTHLIGLQVLNPIQLKSTEKIEIYNSDSMNTASRMWSIQDNLMMFPMTSNSSQLFLHYASGYNPLGDAILVISAVPAWLPDFTTRNRQPHKALIINENRLTGNKNAIMASYFARCHNEEEIFWGKTMELIELSSCSLSDSKQEVVYIDSSVLDICNSNVMDVTIDINHSFISNNEKGILHTSRIHNKPSSAFHWVLQSNIIGNNAGSFELYLPYGWQPNAAIIHNTHSVVVLHNVWRNNHNFEFKIGGGYAKLNVTYNTFYDNFCKTGLISIQGMEKSMYIAHNVIFYNEGSFIMEFKVHSQLEITVETAVIVANEMKGNNDKEGSCTNAKSINKPYRDFTSVLKFHGLQKVKVNRNLFGNNCVDFNIIAEIETMKINDFIDATENWWGSTDEDYIIQRIFHFDDWNNHIVVKFRPYLTEDIFNAPLLYIQYNSKENIDNIDGRMFGNMVLKSRKEPYIVRRDITVMPNASLTIESSVVMLFAPNVGILVLGSLKAMGKKGEEILMLPLQSEVGKMMCKQCAKDQPTKIQTVRLCTGQECDFLNSSKTRDTEQPSEGYLQFHDNTTNQWLPTCDNNFTENDAKVVCRELGFSTNEVSLDFEQYIGFPTIIAHPLWPTSPGCNGDEASVQDCPVEAYIRSGHHLVECKLESLYVYIYCDEKKPDTSLSHWGGIRFARSDFEDKNNQINSESQHSIVQKASFMQYVTILGAGALHSQNSPCIQIISHPASIHETNITSCISDGINIISSVYDTHLFHNSIESTNGVGITITSLALEDRGFEENTPIPLQHLNVPNYLFGILDMCDATKVVTVTEKIFLHFVYDDHPTVCTKIFNSANWNKALGFRFLQFNLFNLAEQDSILIHDGDIRSTSATVMAVINGKNSSIGPFLPTSGQSLSVQLFISNATNATGFIAEVFTLPVPADASRSTVQHNISSCVVRNNTGEGIKVSGLNYAVNVEWNRIIRNCRNPSEKPTTCKSAVIIDVQNTSSIVFKNNLLQDNQGGLLIQANSSNSAATFKGWITNNLFSENKIYPALHVEGSKDNTTQEILILRNYFTKNYAPNIIVIREVPSNFSYNAVTHNGGTYILNVCGYKELYPKNPLTATRNYFYMNEASSTIFVGAPEQEYSNNILLNPTSLFEMTSASVSLFDYFVNSSVNAQNNWWGLISTEDVKDRIFDYSVNSSMLPVKFTPFYNKREDIKQICFIESNITGGSCYLYIGAPMTFLEADSFCKKLNASVPTATKRYSKLHNFLKEQQNVSDPVWVQDSKFGNKCTTFYDKKLLTESCQEVHSFICTTDDSFDFIPAEESRIQRVAIHLLIAVIIILLLTAVYYIAKYKKYCFRRQHQEKSVSQMQLLIHNEAYDDHDGEVFNSFIEGNTEEVARIQDAQSEDKEVADHTSADISGDMYISTNVVEEAADTTHEAAVNRDYKNYEYNGTNLSKRPTLSIEADAIESAADENAEYRGTNFSSGPTLSIEADAIESAADENYEYSGTNFSGRPTLSIEADAIESAADINDEYDGINFSSRCTFIVEAVIESTSDKNYEYDGSNVCSRPTLSVKAEGTESATGIAQETEASRDDESDEYVGTEVLGRLLFGNTSGDVGHDVNEAYEMVEYRNDESNEYNTQGCSQMGVANETGAIEETVDTKCENKDKNTETTL